MSELAEVFQSITERETQRSTARAELAAQNRANFPGAGHVMDALAQFKPRLIWAEENGRTIGRLP